MKATVVISFLFVACAAAHPLLEEVLGDQAAKLVDDFGPINYVLNDEGDFIPMNMDDDDGETEAETKKDLDNRVFFFLHTSDYPAEEYPLHIGDEKQLAKSKFDSTKATKIITHGWINSRKSPACILPRDAYLKHGDYNVILVDWSKISARPYIWASRRVWMVGEYVATMINFLTKHGMDLSRTTLVGHSLGAHVVGIAARNTKGTVQYVVGLDPALPNFALAGPGDRIAVGDAKHVEIIHTNAGLLGYMNAIGDTDFYPNGGSKQMGCLVDVGGACSHARAYRFFAESINSEVGFYGYRCASYVQFKLGRCRSERTLLMGGHKDSLDVNGVYYLDTKASAPYARGS